MLFAHLKRILKLDLYAYEAQTVRVTSSSSQPHACRREAGQAPATQYWRAVKHRAK
jgi:hypothetical protein